MSEPASEIASSRRRAMLIAVTSIALVLGLVCWWWVMGLNGFGHRLEEALVLKVLTGE